MAKMNRFYFDNERAIFEAIEQFRVSEIEIKQVEKVVRHALDEEGKKKYSNKSHFYRVAIMKLLREDLSNIEVKRGRPKKNV